MHVTICICTRDRGPSIVDTLASLEALDYADFEVIVIDQSEDNNTGQAISKLERTTYQLTYVRSFSIGLSTARNIAVSKARGEVIAMTDDDCRVAENWLSSIVVHFQKDSSLGAIFGRVCPANFDGAAGFIPTYNIRHRTRIATPWLKWREGGIGANMAFLRKALDLAGPFDEMLGAGGPLHGCEDGDMTYRILRRGYAVLNAPDVCVIHNGFRSWDQGRDLMRRTGFSVGVAYGKHLRLGDYAVVPTILSEWLRCLSIGRLLRFKRGIGLARFIYFGFGLVSSFRFRVEPQTRLYVPLASATRT